MSTPDELSREEKLSLKALEKALKRCAEAGIRLRGMDNTLYYLPAAIEDTSYDSYLEYGMPVEDHGSYVESGGW